LAASPRERPRGNDFGRGRRRSRSAKGDLRREPILTKFL
jgi:hypothetical protein